jgi:2',3'-cyclic-nucleotide 2'-phosphodiesterase (5'-nucleotidase family)
MQLNKFLVLPLALITLLSVHCKTTYQAETLSYKSYQVSDSQQKDKVLLDLIDPYSDSVNRSMNDIVGYAEKSLDKKQPEGTLGNFMVDVFYEMAKEKFNTHIDIAFMNHGGIRLPQLPAGNVTRGKIFELMPFDNLLIIQRLKGSVLQEFLDLIAAKGGWPVAGMTMQIKDKKAVNVLIAGKPLDPNAVYTTVNSDFMGNGGDNADMLRAVPQENIGYLMRDALLDYISKHKSQGKNIDSNIENRVSYAQ